MLVISSSLKGTSTITKDNGVTIGDLLASLSIENVDEMQPVVSVIPWGEEYSQTGWQLAGLVECYLHSEVETFRKAVQFSSDFILRIFTPKACAHAEAIRVWHRETDCMRREYRSISMSKQSSIMKAIFAILKRRWINAGHDGNTEREHAYWPALALPEGPGNAAEVKCKYTVDFACGVVFNSQDVDLEKIWI